MKVTGIDGKEYMVEPRVDLEGANLNEAVWNDETVFPEGFEIPDELRN